MYMQTPSAINNFIIPSRTQINIHGDIEHRGHIGVNLSIAKINMT